MASRLSRQAPYILLGMALLYLPFRTFFSSLLQGSPKPVLMIAEILPEALLAAALGLAVIQGRVKRTRVAPVIGAACVLLVWSALSIVYGRVDLVQGLIGLLYNFEGLLALLLLWIAPPRPAERKILFMTLAIGLGVIGVVAAAESFIGNGLWIWAGYTPEQHFVGPIPQIRSLFSGPNLLAAVLVVAAGLLLRERPSLLNWGLLVGSGALLGLTYSRSAWLAAAVLGVGYFGYVIVSRRSFWLGLRSLALGLAIIGGAAAGAWRHQATFDQVVWHQQSTTLHVEAGTTTLAGKSAQEILLGSGVGLAGPASFRTGTPDISESWYLQLVDEIGLVGLGLYLALMLLVLRMLFTQGEPVLGFLALGLMVQASFLHIWSDGHFLNVIFWMFVGLALVAVPTTVKMRVKVRKKTPAYAPAGRSRKALVD